ncbi:cupin domain-containing protein [Sphingomonas sp. GlSt437]|uniref:cupin domain-containing protein n=1 Tax=Sphingomonas sp. GlSt437 TaxID=3389970 RepID=UPI003A8C0A33
MPKLNLDTIPQANTSDYPSPFNEAVAGRWVRHLAAVAGLTAMGVGHVVLKPGAWSSQRHWHDEEDEFVVMLSGEAVLVDDSGETVVRAGDCLAFPMGAGNGHHLQNRSVVDCSFIAIGAGNMKGTGGYSDIDMTFDGESYFRKDGTPYPTERQR